MSNQINCPKCNSNQLSANKKGFSGKKAVVGAALTGGVGLLAGTIGSNKIVITCLNCGHQWRPGQADQTRATKKAPDGSSVLGGMVFLAGSILAIVALIKGLWLLLGLAFLALIVFIAIKGKLNQRKYAKMPKDKL